MVINELRVKTFTAGPGGLTCAAEAVVTDEDMNSVYVAYAEDDTGETYAVSAESVYDVLINDGTEAPELMEEYEERKEAKESKYWEVFALLKKTQKAMEKAEQALSAED